MAFDQKKTILLVCMLALAQAQTFSLANFINNQDSGNLKRQVDGPPNCRDWDEDGNCLNCERGYNLRRGECELIRVSTSNTNDEDESSQDIPEGFNPCNGNDNCGESLTFRNAGELTQFINEHTNEPQPEAQPQIRTTGISVQPQAADLVVNDFQAA